MKPYEDIYTEENDQDSEDIFSESWYELADDFDKELELNN